MREDILVHRKEYFISQQRSSLAAIDHSVHWLHPSIKAFPAFSLPFGGRGRGVKKYEGKFGREAALAIDCNDAQCPADDRLEMNELRMAAARGSIMRRLVERAPLKLDPWKSRKDF